MLAQLTRTLERELLGRIQERFGVACEGLNFAVPPRIEFGELTLTIAFDLARKVRRPPAEIAWQLARDAGQIPGIWIVDVAGAGYLNFYLDRGKMALA
ncbi:MAG: hypothetical protein HXY20_07155, partial [Acidobacteria bacterium]|nr:hypothetical protein [Acidobacteriota bacterium]